MAHDAHGYTTTPLFETKKAKGNNFAYRLFATSQFLAIVFVFLYRLWSARDGVPKPWLWFGMLGSELWFGFYWIITKAPRWNPVYRHAFKDRLSQRYENELPGVDIFVCTADPVIEPPMMVMNTVLSVMAYDYPPEKLSVYLSDDGCSDLTFYALLETSEFAKHWIPYCKRFKVEPRSPEAHFRLVSSDEIEQGQAKYLASVKKLYEEMEKRIELAEKLEKGSKKKLFEHRGFSKWDSYISRRDHDTIMQIIIHGKDAESKDREGSWLPTLVYLAREKRPQHPHNFKAGALNALIRVSSEISNAPIILNVDCDMYSNDSSSIRDALCFLLDEVKGHEIAYVQFPQNFYNGTKNDIYGSLRALSGVELPGLDGYGGPLYIGTGCFHRRDTLCGRKFTKGSRFEWKQNTIPSRIESVVELEERVSPLASCTFEKNTMWGSEMGLMYGCAVEDVLTGLTIKCRGWKAAYYIPERSGFMGFATNTLDQILVQHNRWAEGNLKILLSKHSPIWNGPGKISPGLIMGYCLFSFWAINCFATLFYYVVPSLCLLKGIALFPKVSSTWMIPFAYIIVSEAVYSLVELMSFGATALGWWNEQRMWLYKRASSYLFAVIERFLKVMGYADLRFVVSPKVTEDDVSERYERELMEFGSDSAMFKVLASLAMLNLICLVAKAVLWAVRSDRFDFEGLFLQIVLCAVLILINLPLYNAAFFRKDKGRLPSSVTVNSVVVAASLCALVMKNGL